MRGRSCRDASGNGRRGGARGLEGNVPSGTRAAPGLRPRALRPAARSSLMGPGSAGRPDWRHATEPAPEARPGAGKTPSAERREAPAPRFAGRGTEGSAAPFGAPSPSHLFVRGRLPGPLLRGSTPRAPWLGLGRRPARGRKEYGRFRAPAFSGRGPGRPGARVV